MSAIRTFPARPSLAFDRKQAKALLKQLRVGDPTALQRAGAHVARSNTRTSDAWKLADAQRIIAREYGLPSWPRLVDYFADLERHRNAPRHNQVSEPVEHLERTAQQVLRRHASRDEHLARELAQFVPSCYGRSFDDIYATALTLDDAQLVVARRNRCAGWEELLDNAAATAQWEEQRRWEDAESPLRRARAAISSSDLAAVTAIVDAHPDLIVPSAVDRAYRTTIARHALHVEHTAGGPAARQVTDLLASRGADVQRELDAELLGWWPMERDGVTRVQWMLDRGANPQWTPPNGISVLEHAIARFHDAACVDLIAPHVAPTSALWIAAGLGDVAGVRRFIAKRRTLTPAARRSRPDMMAMGVFPSWPLRQDADDLEIMWEAFRIAGLNQRWHTMDVLLDAGLPIDHAPLGFPTVMEAVLTYQRVPLTEYLISCGADLGRDWAPRIGGSVREALRALVENSHENGLSQLQPLLDLCGAGTVAGILAARDAAPRDQITLAPITQRILQLAADDAAILAQNEVSTENLVVGFLRVHGGGLAEIFGGWGVNMGALRSRIGERLRPDADPLSGGDLPLDASANAAVRTATERADALRRDAVWHVHLLYGIMTEESGPGALLLSEVGATLSSLDELFAGIL